MADVFTVFVAVAVDASDSAKLAFRGSASETIQNFVSLKTLFNDVTKYRK